MCACCTSRASEEEHNGGGGFAAWFPGWGSAPANGSRAGNGGDAGGSVEPMPLTRNGAPSAAPGGQPGSPPPQHDEEQSAAVLRRHYTALGDDPSLLLYSICDLPRGSTPELIGVGAAAGGGPRRVQQAVHVPPNTREGIPIETDGFVGKMIALMRTPPEDPAKGDGAKNPYAQYFNRRKRNWEVRVQGQFKRVPKGDMFIGIVLRDFNYDQAIAGHSKIVKRAGMALVRSYDLYMAWGDRQQEALKPNAELSHLVTGMSGWDQIIVTPKGREPPALNGGLQDIGDSYGLNFERNKMGLTNYNEVLDETFRNVSLEDTYTMCFWGVSQVIDVLGWQFKIGTNISMARFFEESPLHVAMYEIERPTNNGRGKKSEFRHLESMKQYYLDAMIWSNTVECPTLPSRYIFQDAPNGLSQGKGVAAGGAGGGAAAPAGASASQGHRERETHGSHNRTLSPCSSTGSVSGTRSLLAAWGERLRWIPDLTCSAHEDRDRRDPRRNSHGR
mmetsp:Transcript_71081/g.179415  ORF Transcript_71081/g.179415 Transcript_71081/m.179415 type:complete len:502 (-) Transcript_71081:160-1665(-)